MKIINPLNRIPETEETMVMACRCVCHTGSASTKSGGASYYTGCGCNCISGNTANNSANGNTAVQH